MSSLRALLRATRAPAAARRPAGSVVRTAPVPAPVLAARQQQLHTSAARGLPYKDDQDRESLKPRAHEHTGSGSDEEAAAHTDAAFNPDKTSPEAAKKTAEQSRSGHQNPLEVSPANRDVAEAGRGKEEDKPHGGQKRPSGAGDAPKGGKVV
ncbi:hypothetical protein GGR56DRAFT_409997 [Xylariaceae sp. FL0804]|nr:hypothetical protein GGR56DRAFT_409997 [Xylariaceae sp. FL0804]